MTNFMTGGWSKERVVILREAVDKSREESV